jgi:retrotransposon gag protein
MNAEERNAIVDDTVQRITQMLTEAGLLKPEGVNNQEGIQNMKNQEDRFLRVDVGEFDGQSLNPEDSIEWEKGLERFFDYRETPAASQYKMAKVKLTKLAAIWFEGIQRQRVRENRPRIDSWDKLKKHLRRKYVPPNYKQQLSVKWNTLVQGNRTATLVS